MTLCSPPALPPGNFPEHWALGGSWSRPRLHARAQPSHGLACRQPKATLTMKANKEPAKDRLRGVRQILASGPAPDWWSWRAGRCYTKSPKLKPKPEGPFSKITESHSCIVTSPREVVWFCLGHDICCYFTMLVTAHIQKSGWFPDDVLNSQVHCTSLSPGLGPWANVLFCV